MALQTRGPRPRERTLAAGVGLAVGLVALAVLALVWLRFVRVGIHWSYGLLAALLAVQVARSALTADWVRRGAALGTVFGVFVMVLGVQPAAFCLTPAAPGCRSVVHLQPSLIVAGLVATTTMAALDVYRGRRRPGRTDRPLP
jgi:hypothetical protein